MVCPPRGGDHVSAQILKDTVSQDEARDLLWRRETRQIGSGRHYVHRDNPGQNTTVVRSAGRLRGIQHVLYTKIGANIRPLTAKEVGQSAPGTD